VPGSTADRKAANSLQDAVVIQQERMGEFQVPAWDQKKLKRLRDAILVLSNNSKTLPSEMLGQLKDVDKLGHMMATAAGWGGNLAIDATYIGAFPPQNDGNVLHSLTVKDVPLAADGFWSITVYNKTGFMEPTDNGIVSLNSRTAKPNTDGSYTINFGREEGEEPINFLPITDGWNYTVRLYRPLQPITCGKWKFPMPKPRSSTSRL